MLIMTFTNWLEGRHKDALGQKSLWDYKPENEPQPSTEEDLQVIYQRGQKKADEFFKTETEGARDFDRAIFGITEVLQARGRNVDWRYVGNRWHNPLASVSKESVDQIIKMMEWAAKPRTLSYQLTNGIETSHSHYYSIPPNPSENNYQEHLDAEARKLIDTEIQQRNQKPTPGWVKIRRNSRTYEEKVAQVIDKARQLVKTQWREGLEKELQERLSDFKRYKLDNVIYAEKYIESSKETVADLRALNANPNVIEEIEKISQEIEVKTRRVRAYHQHEIEQLKQAHDQLQ